MYALIVTTNGSRVNKSIEEYSNNFSSLKKKYNEIIQNIMKGDHVYLINIESGGYIHTGLISTFNKCVSNLLKN